MRDGYQSFRDSPENVCFGCSPHNERGLKLRFEPNGADSAKCEYTVEPHLAGAPGIVHGGIQATILDEVMGVTAHQAFDEDVHLVTVDFRLRYRRPVPVGEPLTIRAKIVGREARDVYMEGAILDARGEVLTRGESRWRQLPPRE